MMRLAPSIFSTLFLAAVSGVSGSLSYTASDDSDTCQAGACSGSSSDAVSASVLIQHVQQNLLSGPAVASERHLPKVVVDEALAPHSNKAEAAANSVDYKTAPRMRVGQALSNLEAAHSVIDAKSIKQDASVAHPSKMPKSIVSFHSMREKKNLMKQAGVQTSATLELDGVAPPPEQLSMLQMSSMHRGMARLAAKTSPRTHKTLRGWTAPLNEEGYQAIVGLKSDDDMEMFIRRVIDAYDSKIVNQGGFMGIVPWFSGTTSSSSYEKLQETLLYAVLSNTKSPWLLYKNSDGTTGSTADLSFMGYVEVAASRNHDEMVKFARRVCDKLGVEVVDEPGFSAMVSFYSGAEGFQDYGKLEHEITSASEAPHTWARKRQKS